MYSVSTACLPIHTMLTLFCSWSHPLINKLQLSVNSHGEPVPHLSLYDEEMREDPVPVYTPTGLVSLATTEGRLVED